MCCWIQPCDTLWLLPCFLIFWPGPGFRANSWLSDLVLRLFFNGNLSLIPLYRQSTTRAILIWLFGLRPNFRVSGRFPAAGSLGRNSRSLDCPRPFHEWFPTRWFLYSAKRASGSEQTRPNLHGMGKRAVGIPNGPRAWASRTAHDGGAHVPLFKDLSSPRTSSYFLSFFLPILH